MDYIFQSNFIFRFQPPNLDELLSKINEFDHTNVDNSAFIWGEYCNVDKIPLNLDEMMPYIAPSIDCISKELEYSDGYFITPPWINLYSKGYFQEVHDHFPWSLACVFFVNDGENFSKFYVKDRNNVNTSQDLQKILYKLNGYNSAHFINIKAGDMIVFPANMLHGVTAHNSDIVRKTFSFNLNFTK